MNNVEDISSGQYIWANDFLHQFFCLLCNVVAVCRRTTLKSRGKRTKKKWAKKRERALLRYFGWISFKHCLIPISHVNEFQLWAKFFLRGRRPMDSFVTFAARTIFHHVWRVSTQKISFSTSEKKITLNISRTRIRFFFAYYFEVGNNLPMWLIYDFSICVLFFFPLCNRYAERSLALAHTKFYKCISLRAPEITYISFN